MLNKSLCEGNLSNNFINLSPESLFDRKWYVMFCITLLIWIILPMRTGNYKLLSLCFTLIMLLAEKYCSLVEEEGGIQLLQALLASPTPYSRIKILARIVIVQCQHYKVSVNCRALTWSMLSLLCRNLVRKIMISSVTDFVRHLILL